jgi:hypothetical protein
MVNHGLDSRELLSDSVKRRKGGWEEDVLFIKLAAGDSSAKELFSAMIMCSRVRAGELIFPVPTAT